MNFLEICSLLILDDQKGNLFTSIAMYDGFMIPSSVLFELLLLHKIHLENNRVIVIDSSSTGNKGLDMALSLIASSKKNKKIITWFEKIAWIYYKIAYSVYEQLELAGILHSIQGKKRKLYFLKDPSIKQKMLDEVAQIVSGNLKPNIYQHLMVVLIKMTYLYRAYILKSDRKQANAQYNAYMKQASLTDFESEKLECMNIIVKTLKREINRRRG